MNPTTTAQERARNATIAVIAALIATGLILGALGIGRAAAPGQQGTLCTGQHVHTEGMVKYARYSLAGDGSLFVRHDFPQMVFGSVHLAPSAVAYPTFQITIGGRNNGTAFTQVIESIGVLATTANAGQASDVPFTFVFEPVDGSGAGTNWWTINVTLNGGHTDGTVSVVDFGCTQDLATVSYAQATFVPTSVAVGSFEGQAHANATWEGRTHANATWCAKTACEGRAHANKTWEGQAHVNATYCLIGVCETYAYGHATYEGQGHANATWCAASGCALGGGTLATLSYVQSTYESRAHANATWESQAHANATWCPNNPAGPAACKASANQKAAFVGNPWFNDTWAQNATFGNVTAEDLTVQGTTHVETSMDQYAQWVPAIGFVLLLFFCARRGYWFTAVPAFVSLIHNVSQAHLWTFTTDFLLIALFACFDLMNVLRSRLTRGTGIGG